MPPPCEGCHACQRNERGDHLHRRRKIMNQRRLVGAPEHVEQDEIVHGALEVP
jgi:hypothetical protein